MKVTQEPYERSLRRYVVTAKMGDLPTSTETLSKTAISTLDKMKDAAGRIPISETLLAQLCGDEDGCDVTLVLKDWDLGKYAEGLMLSKGPYRFSHPNHPASSTKSRVNWMFSRQERVEAGIQIPFTVGARTATAHGSDT